GAAGQAPTVIDLARARVERYPHPAALPQVTPAPIEADLARRDFSVNAMALELCLSGGGLRAGRLLDRFGGQEDLAAGRLRLLHPASLRDDPTRMLRGVRIAARLGMAPEPASRAQIAAALAAGYLALLTPERVLAELCLALEEPRPDAALRLADSWGLTPQILPGLAWGEPLAARCDRLAASQGGLAGGPSVWAGLRLHDLAEAALAALAARYPLPGEAAALLRALAPLRAVAPRLAGQPDSALDRLLRPFSVAAISVLHYAELPAAAARYLRALRPSRPPLDGNDLRRLGVAPGPAMGRLLDELRAATLDGAVTTRVEAEAWVRERLRQPS
ncbi:MAG: CCA tRNA nucleotidyltransferase, partial [Chloroflexales bacterium]|nr:CCA tRNA nucleotidyltransferase [Chloroflexales bacterium]